MKTRFDVRWENNQAKLYPFAAYTPAGGELAAIGTDNKSATVSSTVFAMYDKWGEWVGNNSNNCLQLRGIAVLLNGTVAQFNVSWDGTYAVIETGKPYTGTAMPAKLAETT